MLAEINNVTGRIEPLNNNETRVTITWTKPQNEPIKYIIYITEPTRSRFAIVTDISSSNYTEVIIGKGCYTYTVRAVYQDGTYIESLPITLQIGVTSCCCDNGGSQKANLVWYHERLNFV